MAYTHCPEHGTKLDRRGRCHDCRPSIYDGMSPGEMGFDH